MDFLLLLVAKTMLMERSLITDPHLAKRKEYPNLWNFYEWLNLSEFTPIFKLAIKEVIVIVNIRQTTIFIVQFMTITTIGFLTLILIPKSIVQTTSSVTTITIKFN